ncbi:MAG: retroviral-like aspartic protease family protein [Nitrososphaerales archaeon]|nr:retroviral-like aspartic protease family protein [Nitrososphaerales archaeon]
MKLGETRVKVTVHGPKGSEDVVMLADTGSSHTMVSKDLAERLGIEPMGEAVAELADGTERQLELGRAEIQIGAERERVRVVIGPVGESLLGLSTLETLGFKVNPVAHRLEPAKLILYAAVG